MNRGQEELDNYILAAVGDWISTDKKKALLKSTIGERTKYVIANLESAKKDTYGNLMKSLQDFYSIETSDVIEAGPAQ